MGNETHNLDELGGAADNLGEITRKFDKLLEYTAGDADLAKQIMAGEFQDVAIIKGKIRSDSNQNCGIFMIFLNRTRRSIKNIESSFSKAPYIFENKVNIAWREILSVIRNSHNSDDYSHDLTNDATALFHKHLNQQALIETLSLIDRNELIELSKQIGRWFHDDLGMSKMQIKIEIEFTDSLKTEESQIADESLIVDANRAQAQQTQQKKDELPADISRFNKEAVIGSSLLSPIGGREVSRLRVGDKIKVRITENSPRGRKIQKLFNAEKEDGSIAPLPGKIRYIKHMSDGKWLILVDMGGSVFVRLEEESDNIRIALFDPNESKRSAEKKSSGGGGLWLAISALAFAFVVLAALFFLSQM